MLTAEGLTDPYDMEDLEEEYEEELQYEYENETELAAVETLMRLLPRR
jgi:hypothetical protein